MRFWTTIKDRLFGGDGEEGLTVLAYHRIGDRAATRYDPWVFTADQEQLEEQVSYFRSNHRIVGLQEALAIASGEEKRGGRAILMTFDDGYLDNYEVGLPVLKALDVEAVFFLATSFLAGDTLAWWDRIAWLVKTANEPRFRLPVAGAVQELDLSQMSQADAIKEVLELYKACRPEDVPVVMEGLESAPRDRADPEPERIFLGPQEARELCKAGMRVGSHTHSHRILAQIDPQEQLNELRQSRSILEHETGSTVDVLAYPVGGHGHFTRVTQALTRNCGYRAAFSCHGGDNLPGRSNLYDIKRVPVFWGARPEWLLGA